MTCLNAAEKSEIVEKFKISANDTGSCEVQVAVLSATIERLTGHFKTNPKDIHSKYGLQRMINQRRKLLDYLKRESRERYLKLIQALGLRR